MSMIEAKDGVYASENGWIGMVREDLHALLAAAFPVKPPSIWFNDPMLKMPTPLTITNDGHVMGHIATWKQSHIGMAGSVKAPKSRSNYAYFATGVVECDDGKHVNVGQITLAGGHAPIEASVAETVAHYDNTKSAVMDVAVGEDRHGIWVAGALRPEVTDSQLRAIRASSVSGDWRPISGSLELVAVCSVNVPGFPIPRARVAGGQLVAVVAAGTEELVAQAVLDHYDLDVQAAITASIGTLDSRLRLVEDNLLSRVGDQRALIADAVDEARVLMDSQNQAEAPQPQKLLTEMTADELRERVYGVTDTWEDGMDIASSVQDIMVASLRARRDGTITAGAKKWDAEQRRRASDRGQALPDGSFPIATKKDWHNARQALGRAKNRAAAVRHIKKRGRALGIPADDLRAVHA